MSFRIDERGWGLDVIRLESPNFDARPDGATVDLIVIHNISLPPSQFGGDWIDDLFLNRLDPTAHPYFETIHRFQVSSHFLIKRDGTIKQYVSCDDRAWHAGVSAWRGRTRCNDFAIGIELEGDDYSAFESVQYNTLTHLTQSLIEKYPSIQGIAGHSEIAPGRKTDPGVYFDWLRYEKEASIPAQWRLLA
ncbi:N-acetyl-anhydromuranmyl-L-alanine amidase [Formosimonas limnophila]|uniref:1,6-anhydro-N-acetylmuramyl-L-alanine amidase AmpD n=1 Tax=Formosimonas limnophila TaxID=1384487 RepID=A0A8J3FZU1_9BURK|nr:1,6-anhydro-N-acetylmuramyl-L-alanine amidase AmpD [Formosimonas limnophila]GHA77366.1 N-acetyl-anhydromuranmyl-L-alanine amidase [Formosimonas limnophila]